MKCFVGILAMSAFCLVAFASPIPGNGMIFYQPAGYYPGYPQTARHTMLVRLAPYTAEDSVEESEVSAFASGDTIATNTYLRGSPVAQKQVEGEQVVSQAEAFPVESDAAVNEVAPASDNAPFAADDEADRAPKEYLPPGVLSTGEELPAFDSVAPVAEQEVAIADDQGVANAVAGDDAAPIADVPSSDVAEADAPAEVAPVVPAVAVVAVVPTSGKAVPSKTKIRTELAAAEDDDAEDDYVPFNKQPSRNGGSANGQPWPVNTFFPVNFGSTNGGAIAVANSFSTGKGGAATSHAIAYGSPAKTKTKSV